MGAMRVHSDQKWLWGVALAMPIAFATIAPLHVPLWLTVAVWSIYPVVLTFAILSLMPGYRQLHARKYERPFMGIAAAMVIGAIVGACSAAVIWNWQHGDGDEKPIAATSTTTDDKATVQSDELEFYFFAFMGVAASDNIQYSEVTLTNRSARKMHLELWANIYYWTDKGAPASLGFQPEWNPNGLKEQTGETSLDFDAFETKKGRLVLFIGKPEKQGLSRWNLDATRNVYIHAFESVTGKHIAFKAMSGYPTDKVPWPLPSPKDALVLKFPEVSASEAKNLPALESLGMLLRTRGHMYNDKGVCVPAVIANISASRMKLQMNLITRKSLDDKEWRIYRGLLIPSSQKNPPEYYALDFGPGDVADCSLVFANTGFTNAEGSHLDESPSVSLLEIFDEVSRKKAWCAIEPGYPPGTDMRWAAIPSPPEIPKSNSSNPPKDASKDSK
jgi:hypothetical protein